MTRTCFELLNAQWERGNYVCVGLDPDMERIPEHIKGGYPEKMLLYAAVVFNDFCFPIIQRTADKVCAYKLNVEFWTKYGAVGLVGLGYVVDAIRAVAPEVPIIMDGKRADCFHTSQASASMAFEEYSFHAVTVNPYLGKEALEPFLSQVDKGVFVVCRTSNPGAEEFQKLLVSGGNGALYIVVARHVAQSWNTRGNCGLVVGATSPQCINNVRQYAGDLPILCPGIGAQGGDIRTVVEAGQGNSSFALIPSASRSVIYASSGKDYAQAAEVEVVRLNKEAHKAYVG